MLTQFHFICSNNTYVVVICYRVPAKLKKWKGLKKTFNIDLVKRKIYVWHFHSFNWVVYMSVCVFVFREWGKRTDRRYLYTHTHTYTQEQGVLTLSGTLKYLKTDLIVWLFIVHCGNSMWWVNSPPFHPFLYFVKEKLFLVSQSL